MIDRFPFNKFRPGADHEYRDTEDDASPVAWGIYSFVECLEPHCDWTEEIGPELTVASMMNLCERHWYEAHVRPSSQDGPY